MSFYVYMYRHYLWHRPPTFFCTSSVRVFLEEHNCSLCVAKPLFTETIFFQDHLKHESKLENICLYMFWGCAVNCSARNDSLEVCRITWSIFCSKQNICCIGFQVARKKCSARTFQNPAFEKTWFSRITSSIFYMRRMSACIRFQGAEKNISARTFEINRNWYF